MSIVSIALRIYPCNSHSIVTFFFIVYVYNNVLRYYCDSHSIVTLFFIVYVYNNVLRYYCDELFASIEVSNTEDASRKKGLWYLLCCTI